VIDRARLILQRCYPLGDFGFLVLLTESYQHFPSPSHLFFSLLSFCSMCTLTFILMGHFGLVLHILRTSSLWVTLLPRVTWTCLQRRGCVSTAPAAPYSTSLFVVCGLLLCGLPLCLPPTFPFSSFVQAVQMLCLHARTLPVMRETMRLTGLSDPLLGILKQNTGGIAMRSVASQLLARQGQRRAW
jgi:hypothetical protein